MDLKFIVIPPAENGNTGRAVPHFTIMDPVRPFVTAMFEEKFSDFSVHKPAIFKTTKSYDFIVKIPGRDQCFIFIYGLTGQIE